MSHQNRELRCWSESSTLPQSSAWKHHQWKRLSCHRHDKNNNDKALTYDTMLYSLAHNVGEIRHIPFLLRFNFNCDVHKKRFRELRDNKLCLLQVPCCAFSKPWYQRTMIFPLMRPPCGCWLFHNTGSEQMQHGIRPLEANRLFFKKRELRLRPLIKKE